MSEGDVSTHLFAGAVAGLAETISVQPIDMIKTRQQLHSSNTSIVNTSKTILSEGGVLRFYRGLLPPVAGMVPQTALMFASNEQIKRLFASRTGEPPSLGVATLAGAISGLPEAISITPFEVVKIRLQSQAFNGQYQNTSHCVRTMLKEEGIPALFRGFVPTCFRNCIWNGIYFGLIHLSKDKIPLQPETQTGQVAFSFLSGLAAGAVATLFNTPFDVVKSRFQNEVIRPETLPSQRVFRHTAQSIQHLYMTEGLSSLYRSLPAKMIRMSIGGGVSIVVFEMVCSMIVSGNE